MGKNQKTQRNQQLRELREKQQREALAKKKKEQRLMLIIGLSVLVLICIGVSILIVNLINQNEGEIPQGATDFSNAPIQYNLADTSTYVASATATNYVKLNVSYTADNGQRYNGDIIVKLDSQNAPITVANFQKLVGEGFYDGLIFHRVIEDFMIQGGDPKGTGTGGSDEEIKGEFAMNGVNNTLRHERGVISMARSDDYNSASSQFFIVHKTSSHLDGLYAAFGNVVFGMENVDGIAAVSTNNNDKPIREAKIVSASFVNYVQYDLADTNTYTVSQTATDYVKLNVSYTADNGQCHNGDIIVKLDPQNAPITVANFQKLVGEGFYDGLIFHRVIEDFMIQGGDSKGDGTGGSNETIKGEFTANGVNNTIKHERGVISMARSGMHYNSQGQLDNGYNTASSQFFIVHQTYPSLDGQYAAFGHVVFGMTSVDGIATVATNGSDKPIREAKIESAVFVNYIEQGE